MNPTGRPWTAQPIGYMDEYGYREPRCPDPEAVDTPETLFLGDEVSRALDALKHAYERLGQD